MVAKIDGMEDFCIFEALYELHIISWVGRNP